MNDTSVLLFLNKRVRIYLQIAEAQFLCTHHVDLRMCEHTARINNVPRERDDHTRAGSQYLRVCIWK
jgi:hypothetical protein